ncbi:ISL3 family transposase [Pedobacter sp. PAMC26386]|nr:ISL3 family transposase [Pedobacter sp. PAMC26386]
MSLCFKNSHTVRSFYFRTLIDLPMVGKKVFILLKIRRFACKNFKCLKLIFSEQCNYITTPYSRRTERATGYLRQVLIEISSNKGAYFSKLMQIPVSNNTCLRLIKSMNMLLHDSLLCVGIDDWAKRKGMNYGSILVNAETGCTIDLLNSMDSNDVIDWFSAHQQVKYVTRDRATSYASAITKSIPAAKQIADRFHLVKNLSDVLLEEIRLEYGHLKQIAKNISPDAETMSSNTTGVNASSDVNSVSKASISSYMTERQERFQLMAKLEKDGHNLSDIARRTQMNWRTVKKYLTSSIPLIQRETRINYNKYMSQINHMVHLEINPTAMFKSLKDLGLNCCERSFTRWFTINFPDYQHKWSRICPQPLKNEQPSIWINYIPPLKKLSIFVMNPDYGVSKETGECSKEKEIVDGLLNKVPILASLRRAYIDFRKVLKGGCPEQLDLWIKDVQSMSRKKIDRFCNGLKKEILAVKNAIIYNWTNGLVEGCVNRLKNKKREMYGRCGFQLLRRKVCLSVMG